MLRIKQGVRVKGLSPETVLAATVAATMYKELYGVDGVITSGTSGKHMRGSKHYSGHAIDIRTRNLPDATAKHQTAKKLQHALGEDYDVVLEGLSTPHEHIHIEYDPKT